MIHYKLDGKIPVPCDIEEWARWMATANRTVAADHIGDVLISTVFIGLDQQFRPDGPPVLFETMVFGGPTDNERMRCATYAEAEAMHRAMRDIVREMVDEAALAMDRARSPAHRPR